ncbi:Ig-like domain-containing protein [Balneolaceae bacterium ANBcel3]|nr:Ig-like domain-containing protein [Balneolaceae bacterium ANBcel3]
MTVFSKKFTSGICATMLSLIFLVFLVQCDSSSGPKYDPITVEGKVVAAQTNAPIEGALVRILSPLPEKHTVTDEEGMYRFELEVDSTTRYFFEYSKEEDEYITQTREITLVPEIDRSLSDIRMRREGEAADDDPDDLPPGEEVGPPHSIVLFEQSEDFLHLKGVGNIEQASFDFRVTDAAGYPVRGAEVTFKLGESPGGGEKLYPDTTVTGGNGIAQTVLTSGTIAGPVQIIASVEGEDEVIFSEPIKIGISSGKPHANHFTLKVETGGHKLEQEDEVAIMALVGDRSGNPVAEGTVVNFTTNGGVISPGSGRTDEQGRVQVSLEYGNPIPSDGYVTITAKTVDENNSDLTVTGEVLFIQPSVNITVSPDDFEINQLIDKRFEYTVTDSRGNPLAEGTSITVEIDNDDYKIVGHVDETVGAGMNSGLGVTDFEFVVRRVAEELSGRPVTITVKAETPSNLSNEFRMTAESFAGEGSMPQSIVLHSQSHDAIYIKGEGNVEQAELRYRVTDADGYPVRGAEVSFDFGVTPDGGEHLSPETVETDNEGIARTVLTSGTRSGVVQIIASVQGEHGMVEARPVRIGIASGMPHPDFSTLRLERTKLEDGQEMSVSVTYGDRYGNPISSGTAVNFVTTHGIIRPGSVKTDANGRASVTLEYVNLIPDDGWGTITATTVDENNNELTLTGSVLFMIPPIEIEVTPNTFNIDFESDQDFTYRVTDRNGHPLPEGTNIIVDVESEDFEVIGDVDVIIGRQTTPGPGATVFGFNVMSTSDEPLDRPVYIRVTARTPGGASATVQVTGRKQKIAR